MPRQSYYAPISIVDNLHDAMQKADVPRTAMARILNMNYVTLCKYLTKERRLCDKELTKKIVAGTTLLNQMIAQEVLPLPPEVRPQARTKLVIKEFNEFARRMS